MTRRGSALAIVVVAASVALLAAGSLMSASSARRTAAQQHHTRIQARELALGGLTLPVGATCSVLAWTVRHTADGVVVQGSAGTYRIAPDGRESWSTP